jgi:hypothetical protein
VVTGLDVDGYPTEASLRRIRKWDFEDGYRPMMEFVRSIWWAADWGWHESGRRPAEIHTATHRAGSRYYQISTGGWSGNESIIGALEANHMFMALCWERSRKGGHYLFAVPKFVAESVRA